MQRKPSLAAVFLLISLVLFQGLAPDLQAQTAPPPTPQELDQLLAPVALYPDSLLAQITTASTNPQEILDVDQWLSQNQNLSVSQLTSAAQQQGFDPAFIALVSFPQVLEMMAENIDDYAAIGAAVTANQGEVSASIQRLRAQAYASGALRSNQQQQVDVQQYSGQPVYAIQPANPQVVYVPQYDPTVVYAGGGGVGAAPLIAFGLGIGITALLVSQPWGWGGWGWNWGARRVYYNHAAWGGWNGGYRPSRPWYRPRPVMYRNRPGFGGNWRYRPPNYRPPTPIHRPGYSRPGGRPPYSRPGNNRPVNGPGNNRPGNGGRPSIQPVRPGTPNNRPPNRPVNGPGNNRPGNGGRPTIQPVRPGRPNNRPPNQARPTQQRPAAQNRPAPRPPNQARPPQQARPQQQRPQGGDGPRGPR
jgi:Protein of unknown function (DUF3300)